MPIVTLTASSIDHVCAGCGRTLQVRLDELRLGVSVETEQRANKDVIRLPACPDCGAVEHLLRSWAPPAEVSTDVGAGAEAGDGAGAGGHRHEHRRVVNRLAAMLKDKGRVDKGCAEAIAQETGDPPDINPDTPKGRRGRIDIGPPPGLATNSEGES